MDEVTIPLGYISSYDMLCLQEKVIIPQMVGMSMCAHYIRDVIGFQPILLQSCGNKKGYEKENTIAETCVTSKKRRI